jgi:hypothetical protein
MNIAELVGIVAGSRARTNLAFPLPDVSGCVDYAICEAAEAIDARLRQKRNGDKRNNERQVNERIEWGQCGYMIASGLMQTDYELQGYVSDGGTVYDVLHWLAQEAVEADSSLVDAMIDWVIVCQFEEWEPAQLLRDTCAEFERKHIGEVAA